MGANSSIGHFWHEVGTYSDRAVLDELEGFGSAIGDTFRGLTSGDFDYTNTKNDFENLGNDFKDAYYGRPVSEGRHHAAKSYAQQVAAAWQNVYSHAGQDDTPNAVGGTSGGGSYGTTGNANVHYGQAVGNPNVKPSDLMKISDPTAKTMISASRGATRRALHNVGKQIDNAASASLAQSTQGQASDNTNSAGGVGASTSVDVGNDQHN